MPKLRIAGEERAAVNEPIHLGDRAIDNLRFIRETMERSTHFTAVPGYGGMLMGATAIAAAIIANQQTSPQSWLTVWIAEAFLAFAIGVLAMWQKSKLGSTSLISTPAKKFASGFVPALVCGIILTAGLWKYGMYELMAATWMVIYGAAVIGGGAFSVRPIPIMGWCFVALGAAAMFLPKGFGDEMMALSFGLTHIIFGAVIAKKYGG